VNEAAVILRLETFGTARLLCGHESAPQRRRIALFALLAVAGDRGMLREKLLGYLWPESTADNARHSLDQLIYGIRRAYGEEVLVGANPVHLNVDLVSSDVADFERAFSAGDFEKAVGAYAGPFLDGFVVPDAPEFERWATVERQQFEEKAARAFDHLAHEASARTDHARAANWLRRRAALDPLSAHGAVLLMEALADAGDAASALQHAALYERLVRQELDSDPDPVVTTLAAQLRARRADTLPLQPSSPDSKLRDTAPVTQATTEVIPSPAKNGRLPRRWFAAGVLAATFVIAFVVYYSRLDTASPTDGQQTRVVVLPFRIAAKDSSLAYLAEGMVDLISARLTGEGGPLAANPRAVIAQWHAQQRIDASLQRGAIVARALDAQELVEGELIQTADRELTLNGRVSAIDGRVLAAETIRGQIDSVAMLADNLAIRLLVRRAGEAERRASSFVRVPNDAVIAFLQGRAEYRRGHVATAREYFAKALDRDSTFATAALELGLATGQVFQWSTVTTDTVRRTRGVTMGGLGSASPDDQWRRAMIVATRDSLSLSTRDRFLLTALRGGYPRVASARQVLANWETAAQALPDLPDAQFWLGHVLLFQGPALGIDDSRVRARAAFERALHVDPQYAPALNGLIELAALERDTSALHSRVDRYMAMDSLSDDARYIRWRLSSFAGDEEARLGFRISLSALERDALARIRLMAQLDGRAITDGVRASDLLVARASSALERQLALHSARQLALNRGRPLEAVRIAQEKRSLEPNADLQRGFAIRDALFWEGDTASAVDAARAFESILSGGTQERLDDRRKSYIRFSAALWRLSHGDTSRVNDDIRALRRSPTGRDPQSQLLDALLASIVGRPDAERVLTRLDSLALLGFGPAPHVINLVSARIHERRGDLAGALAAVRRGRWFFPPENLSTYLREEGRLAQLTGDNAGAVRAWTHYLALRSDAESSMKPEVERIRARLAVIQKP
jgi:DNA-binding SARP family transcriptional activator/TolB-like protein